MATVRFIVKGGSDFGGDPTYMLISGVAGSGSRAGSW